MSPGHRREFLLDSGAISALANDPKVLRAYADLLRTTYSGSLRIPVTVMTECRTGDPDDIKLLVDLTRRTNISIQRVG